MNSPEGLAQPDVRHIPRFWDMISLRQSKLLALDYDGTLAPFHVHRMEALPLKGIPDLMKKISLREDTTLAVISGRPLDELEILLKPWKGIMIGSHGFERRFSTGQIFIKKISFRQQEGLSYAHSMILDMGIEMHIEKKPASIAFHTRGLGESSAGRLEEEVALEWSRIASRCSLEVRKFQGGVEVLAKGWNKGDALEELLRDEPQDTFCVYIGDDSTDEDAFQRIRSSGIGIRVGKREIPTAARGLLPDIHTVKGFLEAWVNLPLKSSRERCHEA